MTRWLRNKYQVLEPEEILNYLFGLYPLPQGIPHHVRILVTFGKKNDVFEFNLCELTNDSKL